jgi:hypothetical protein
VFGSGGVIGIVAFPEHASAAPTTSAKLITIDGVPDGNAAKNAFACAVLVSAGNNPSVN